MNEWKMERRSAATYTDDEMQFIRENYKDMTIEKIMEITNMTRYRVIELCKLAGAVPKPGRKDSQNKQVQAPLKTKKLPKPYVAPDKPLKMERPKAVYTNTKWSDKYLD